MQIISQIKFNSFPLLLPSLTPLPLLLFSFLFLPFLQIVMAELQAPMQ
jgi:hypothetical protein